MVIKLLRSFFTFTVTCKRTYLKLVITCLAFAFVQNENFAQTAAFTASTTSGCKPLSSITFTDNSIGATSWKWDLGNSNSSELQNPQANYIDPGAYTVILTINNGGSPELTSTQIINVYPTPAPTIPSPISGCEPFSGLLVADATPVTIMGNGIFGNITGGVPVSYSWNFGGALPTVIQTSPVLMLTDVPAGSYDVLLTVTDEYGCSSSLYQQNVIYVSPKPIANFNISKVNKCSIGKVNFADNSVISSGGIASYEWDLNNDGTIESTQKNFSYIYSAVGEYEIALRVKSDEGCYSDKIVKKIVFNAENTIDFNSTGGCINKSVSFIDASNINAVKWLWDFDNNGTIDDSIQNPTFKYSTDGIILAKLKVIFSDSCEMELSKPVQITKLNADFTYDINSSCAPEYKILFNSTSTVSNGSTIISYDWDFDNDGGADFSTPNPIYNFNSAGSYPINLEITSSDGCRDSIQKTIIIENAAINISASVKEGCIPLNPTLSCSYLQIQDPIVSYNWNFGDPSSGGNNSSTVANPSHTYNNEGVYKLFLTVNTQKGCELKDSLEIKAGSKKVVDILSVNQGDSCLKTPVEFDATFDPSVTELSWKFSDDLLPQIQPVTGGSSKITFLYPKPGIYSASVVALCNGCEGIIPMSKDSITIKEPKAIFAPSSESECAVPATISFTNTSISDRAVTTWSWDFGDGTTSTDEAPTHEYTATGDYEVKLTVSNSKTNCEDDSSIKIFINTTNPNFTANTTEICAGSDIVFTNDVVTSSSSNFTVASYYWNFGDGESSTVANPTHKYKVPGLYTVKFDVKGTHGCDKTVTKNNFINVRGPLVNFTKDKGAICEGDSIKFTNTTTKILSDNANHSLNQYLWDFGDGTTSDKENPTHTYNLSDTYPIKLKVTDNNGCSSTKLMLDSIKVQQILAGFTTLRNSYCVDSINPIVFSNTAVGSNVSCEWDFDGDGIYDLATPSATDTSFLFKSKGIFTIKQKVKNNLGCEDIFTKTITIGDGDASFNWSLTTSSCAPVNATFEALVDIAEVSSYLWKFGDGVTSTERNPNHDYLKPGKFTVTLTVTLLGGCIKSSSKIITIPGAVGKLNYSNASGCAPYTATFYADNLSGATELIWDFGDGFTLLENILATDTSKTTTYTYNSYGSRLPLIILRDPSCGAYSYYDPKRRINTSQPPIADFSSSVVAGQSCEQLPIQFTDLSTKVDPRYSIAKWNWDFGDGTSSELQNPIHAYNTQGTYIVTLKISNGVITSPPGCEASTTKNIKINPLPIATSPTQMQTIYTGLASKDIILSSLTPGTTYNWTRTNPVGIITEQALSGQVDSLTNTIESAVFINETSSPLTVTYTITPTGPTATFCEGSPLLATVTVKPNQIKDLYLIKTSSLAVFANNGTFDWKYTITIKNDSEETIDSIQVIDNLNEVFLPKGFSYSVTGIKASGNLVANGLFNGSSITKTLLDGKSMGAHQVDSIEIRLNVDTHKKTEMDSVFNQAVLAYKFILKDSIGSDSNYPITPLIKDRTKTIIPFIDIYIPDAFSPNNDGINEYYVITHTDLVKFDIEVFNRWGNSVYKSIDYQNNWDGKGTGNFLGKDLPSGTYYCVYKILNSANGEAIGNGVKYITLRR